MSTAWPEVLGALVSGTDLTPDQAAWAMEQVLSGAATPAQVSGFAIGLRSKGETATEVAALAEVMLAHARLAPVTAGPTLDVVGTGGDQLHTVNISTMASLVCAAAGAPIVKHGNRAASSSTGTADVLEELGVAIDLEPGLVAECVADAGIGFCFAPTHHPAMRHAGPSRRELGIPTVFNILGPLTNPGQAASALIGCASLAWAPIMAAVLARRGVRALIVRGDDGLDEVSTCSVTRVWDARGPEVVQTTVDAADWGIARATVSDLRGGDSARNAALLRKALGQCRPDDPDASQVARIRDAVALNAAAALVAFDCARGEADAQPGAIPLADAIAARLARTQEIVRTGAAEGVLDRWIAVSTALAGAGQA